MIETLEKLINNIITTLYTDPIYLVIAVIISGLLIFSLLKRLIKIAVYLLAIGILYLGYLYYTGESVDSVIDGYKKITQEVKDGIEDSIDEILPQED